MDDLELEQMIRQYIKSNLSLRLEKTSGWSESGEQTLSVNLQLLLDNEVIDSVCME